MKTIQMTIDEPLLKAVDRASKARKTTRSAFIRYAVEAELQSADSRTVAEDDGSSWSGRGGVV